MRRAIEMVAILSLAATSTVTGQEPKSGFLERSVRIDGASRAYKVYVPPGFDPRRSWPVILFLHGAGEGGVDGVQQTEVGLGRALRTHPERFPAVVVFPQAPYGQVWLGEHARVAAAALEQTIAEFRGDPDRIYLAGLSMGGYGSWSLAFESPERYAAIVSVCGGIVPPPGGRTRLAQLPPTLSAADPYAVTAARLKSVPAWLFHGAGDRTVPVTESRRIVAALEQVGASPRYSEYEGVGHNSWDRAFAEPELPVWLFAQRRKGGASSTAAPREADRFWPQWRGPLATGVAPHARPPVEWSETKNVRWKVEVPGRGSSSPIVWGDLVIVTTAVPIAKALPRAETAAPSSGRAHPAVSPPESAQAFEVLAYQRADGTLRWRRTVREEFPHEGTHKDGTFASASAVTDGERVYAFFGSRGLYALDMDGRLVWQKDLGDMTVKLGFGEGASPALHADRLVVTWDHEGESFLVALDTRTGRELWRTPREEKTTWATPVVVVHGKPQVVTAATNRVRAYDLRDGTLLWDAPGLTPNTIPTPVHGDGLLYLTSGFRGNALMAVKLAEARGDIGGGPAIAWRYDQNTPYVPSPLLYGGGLYFLKSNSGILTRLDAKTGEKNFTERVATLENVYASPVAAAGRVYVVDRGGTTAVLEAGPALEVLAVNTLDDGFDASPALVDGELYLRGRRHLYAIAEAPSAARAEPPSDPFWSALRALCGKAFEGRVVEGTEPSDEAIRKERLVMHVRTCTPAELRVPFHVGTDRSRTWVITPSGSGLRLKHDHRHEDGSEDRITHYGGDTRAAETALRREFFADAHTAALIPAAAENVWTMALEPGKTFSYALRREKQDRRFRVEFDLTREVPAPPAPW